MLHRPVPVRLRTLFLSDIHLGTRGCRADLLLDFLNHYSAEKIYLVGDIFDGWRLRRVWHWPPAHTAVVQKLIGLAMTGTQLIYLPGNHDEFMRNYVDNAFGDIVVAERVVHETADGKRLLVLHGDQFDVVVRWAPWLSMLGASIYNLTLAVNGVVNRVRRLFGFGYWSLADWTKQKVKNAVGIIGDYEKALVREAKSAGADGVVCGHIHHADIHDRFGIRYVNTGDWMESCTAVGEDHNGRLEIIRWSGSATMRRAAMAVVPDRVEADAA